jgi:hypothetical protein
MKTTTLEESAQLEVQGAEHRLECAVRGLRDFQRVFGEIDDEGVFTFRPGIEVALLPSLERELRGHHVEVDEAWRALKHAQAVLAETKEDRNAN